MSLMKSTINKEDDVYRRRNTTKNVKLNEDVIPCKKRSQNHKKNNEKIKY